MAPFSCKVVHIAFTPLAGSPIRIVRALNAHSPVTARLFTLNDYPATTGFSYPADLRGWIDTERAEFTELVESADVIHLHHWLELTNNPLGIDFTPHLQRGVKIVRQFHSNPTFVARHFATTPEHILNDPLPVLTLPQLHERFYPRARLVPNIVPLDEPPYADSCSLDDDALSVYFRPSGYGSAWSDRWETKGAPEVMAVLEWAKKNVPGIRIDAELRGIPHEEHLRRRAACLLGIDDVVTGSFHLTSLETMAQGRAIICHLDSRQILALARFAGCDELPFINFPVEDLPIVLKSLASQLPLVRELGQQGRRWMERFWHPKAMVDHYVSVYRDLLAGDPKAFARPRFEVHNPAVRWTVREADDIKWLIRRNRLSGGAPAKT